MESALAVGVWEMTRALRASAVGLVPIHAGPWGRRLAQAFFSAARATTYDGKLVNGSLFGTMPAAALAIPPEMADEAATGWPEAA